MVLQRLQRVHQSVPNSNVAFAVHTQCKVLHVGNHLNPSLGPRLQCPPNNDTLPLHVLFEDWSPYHKDSPMHRPMWQNCSVISVV